MNVPSSQTTLVILLIIDLPQSASLEPLLFILTLNTFSHSPKWGSMRRKASQKVMKAAIWRMESGARWKSSP